MMIATITGAAPHIGSSFMAAFTSSGSNTELLRCPAKSCHLDSFCTCASLFSLPPLG